MKDYALVCVYKPLKGFFKKTVAGEYLIFAAKTSGTMAVFQFFDKYKDYYIVAFEGGFDSVDDEDLEEGMDGLRYSANVEILEDNIKVKDKQMGNKWEFTFSPSSKYLGNKLTLLTDSRLPRGYFFADVKLKKGFVIENLRELEDHLMRF